MRLGSITQTSKIPGWLVRQSYVSGALIAALATVAWHRRWEQTDDGTPARGLLDGLCHAGTAIAVAMPALPYVRDRAGFLRLALLSGIALDLDHVLVARSIRLERTMTMPQRPASHSLLAPVLLAVLAERLRPERHLGLAALLGLSSHLLRDLGTGGAPLVHPRRIITMPNPMVVLMLATLAFSSRTATRLALGAKLHSLRLLRAAAR